METREDGIFKQIKRRGGILSVKVQSRIAFYGHDFEYLSQIIGSQIREFFAVDSYS